MKSFILSAICNQKTWRGHRKRNNIVHMSSPHRNSVYSTLQHTPSAYVVYKVINFNEIKKEIKIARAVLIWASVHILVRGQTKPNSDDYTKVRQQLRNTINVDVFKTSKIVVFNMSWFQIKQLLPLRVENIVNSIHFYVANNFYTI